MEIFHLKDKNIFLAKLNDKEIEKLHSGDPRTVVDYQFAWAKTYLKKYSYIESSVRRICYLTEKAYSEKLANNGMWLVLVAGKLTAPGHNKIHKKLPKSLVTTIL